MEASTCTYMYVQGGTIRNIMIYPEEILNLGFGSIGFNSKWTLLEPEFEG